MQPAFCHLSSSRPLWRSDAKPAAKVGALPLGLSGNPAIRTQHCTCLNMFVFTPDLTGSGSHSACDVCQHTHCPVCAARWRVRAAQEAAGCGHGAAGPCAAPRRPSPLFNRPGQFRLPGGLLKSQHVGPSTLLHGPHAPLCSRLPRASLVQVCTSGQQLPAFACSAMSACCSGTRAPSAGSLRSTWPRSSTRCGRAERALAPLRADDSLQLRDGLPRRTPDRACLKLSVPAADRGGRGCQAAGAQRAAP